MNMVTHDKGSAILAYRQSAIYIFNSSFDFVAGVDGGAIVVCVYYLIGQCIPKIRIHRFLIS